MVTLGKMLPSPRPGPPLLSMDYSYLWKGLEVCLGIKDFTPHHIDCILL